MSVHNNNEDREIKLLRLYEQWRQEIDSGKSRTLKEWLDENPDFQNEIREFLILELLDTQIATAGLTEEDLKRLGPEFERILNDQIKESVRRYMGEATETAGSSRASSSAAPNAYSLDIREELQRRKINLANLEEMLKLPLPFLQKLLHCHFRPDSLPQQLLTQFAQMLQQPPEAISAYFHNAPMPLRGANYRAHTRPTINRQQEDFWKALENEAALTPDQKQFWQKLKDT